MKDKKDEKTINTEFEMALDIYGDGSMVIVENTKKTPVDRDKEIITDAVLDEMRNMNAIERMAYFNRLYDSFYKQNLEYAKFFGRIDRPTYIDETRQFLTDLTKADFEACEIPASKYDELQKVLNEDAADNLDIKDIALIATDILTEPQLAALYYLKNPREEAENVTVSHANKIEYPLDKPNHYIWNLLEKDTQGQITFDMLPKKPELEAYTTYSINFRDLGDGLRITKRLTPFDKRVYIAVSALYNAGNNIITLSQIYYAMGNTGRPGQRDLTKINDAITKMKHAEITLDSSGEAEKIKNYKKFVYDGDLLPMERLTAVVNGKVTEGAINLFREPPLMSFAKERKQVTTLDIKLLQSPISKTDANLLIDDYLLERINKEKRSNKKSCTILLETLYQYANITTKKQKQRAPEKIEKYLKYYREAGLFKNYKIANEKIAISF